MSETVKKDNDKVTIANYGETAMQEAKQQDFDLIVVSLNMRDEDGLRLCSFFKSNEKSRSVPILMVGEEQDMDKIARGLEIGAHDYILRPLDRNEFIARIRTQIRRKRYQDRLRTNYELSLSMALTDELTGLYNRRYLTVHMDKILSKFNIDKKPVTVLMLDIDHFKSVNDTYGHDVGDDVLKVFSERISKCLRSFDMVARMGGEEFIALLPDAPKEVAIQVAERLRRSIANNPIPSKGVDSGELTVTVSIGGVVLTEEDEGITQEEAIKRADDALYEAKNGGRNKCVFYKIGEINPADIVENKRPQHSEDTDNNATDSNPQQEDVAPVPKPPMSGTPADPFANDTNSKNNNNNADEFIVAPPPPSPTQNAEPDFFIDPSLTDPMKVDEK